MAGATMRRWAVSRPTLSGCTKCSATFGSGAWTGSTRASIPAVLKWTRSRPGKAPPSACPAAAASTSPLSTRARRTAPASRRRMPATPSVFVPPGPSRSDFSLSPLSWTRARRMAHVFGTWGCQVAGGGSPPGHVGRDRIRVDDGGLRGRRPRPDLRGRRSRHGAERRYTRGDVDGPRVASGSAERAAIPPSVARPLEALGVAPRPSTCGEDRAGALSIRASY